MLYLIFLGAVIGFLYDFFRELRRKTNNNTLLCVICDFVFWILAIFLSFRMLFNKYSFDLRVYHFFFIMTGLCIYFAFLSDFFAFIVCKILNLFEFFFGLVFTIAAFCVKIIKSCFLFIIFPFRWIFGKTKNLKFFKRIASLFKFIKLKISEWLHISERKQKKSKNIKQRK